MKFEHKFAISVNGKTFMYVSFDEAAKMARFMGLSVAAVKELHVF